MKKNYYILVAFSFLILNINQIFAENPLKIKVNNSINAYLANHHLNAVYVFATDEEILAQGTQGLHTHETKKELFLTQIMPVASTTKMVTAAGILRLQDKGLIDVQDLVVKHLNIDSGIWKGKELPKWADKLRIHHLLTHRSGLAEYFMALDIDLNKTHQQINQDIAGFAASNDLAFIPGGKYNYNNTNFVLLGLIIEQISGLSLEEFYKKEFFEPLDMKFTKLLTIQEAVDYQKNPESNIYPMRYFVTPNIGGPVYNLAKADYIMIPYADGGLVSTAEDIIKWHKALHNGKILSEASYQLMTTRHYEAMNKIGQKNFTGYGLFISELENGDIIYHHAGSALAIRAESGYIPSKKLYYAILSNVMPHIPKDMQDKISLNDPTNQLDIYYFVKHILNSLR